MVRFRFGFLGYSFLVLVIGLIIAAFIHGIHEPINWSRAEFSGLSGVAFSHVGHYKNTYTVLKSVADSLVADGVLSMSTLKQRPAFGVFYDNPKETDAIACRFKAGYLVSSSELKAISSRMNKNRNPPYELLKFPKQKVYSASFPFVSMLSIFLGLFKAYPALEGMNLQHGAVIEIYDHNNSTIQYFALDRKSSNNKF